MKDFVVDIMHNKNIANIVAVYILLNNGMSCNYAYIDVKYIT